MTATNTGRTEHDAAAEDAYFDLLIASRNITEHAAVMAWGEGQRDKRFHDNMIREHAKTIAKAVARLEQVR